MTRNLRQCSFPGCYVATTEARCPKHQQDTPFPSYYQPPKRNHPPRSDGAIYRTARWYRLRRKKLAENPFCEEPGCHAGAVDVHHIKPVADGGPMWDMENLQSLCKSHHSAKRIADVNIAWGLEPPPSDKYDVDGGTGSKATVQEP